MTREQITTDIATARALEAYERLNPTANVTDIEGPFADDGRRYWLVTDRKARVRWYE